MFKINNLLGQTLELPKNASVSIERNNPLFSADDAFVQDITMPGQAGLTDNNKLFIKNGHLVESKNEVYEIPVQVFVADFQFYRALFTYKISKGQIEYLLKVNLGEVVAKMKTAILQDLYTTDAIQVPPAAGEFEAYMKETCMNPQNHPCAFFPVRNPSWNPNNTVAHTFEWLNEWDHINQKFRGTGAGEVMTSIGIAPFFKASYILTKVFEYLKLNVSGNLLTDQEFQQMYIYTRKSVLLHRMESSMMYMPRITIYDLLIQLKERFRISFDFDLMNNTVVMETPRTVFSSSESINITPYIETVDDKGIAEQKGYRVTLKVDEGDEQSNIGTLTTPVYESPFTLVVGNGENKVELAIGTLREFADGTDYIYPYVDQVFNNSFAPGEINDWQLRFVSFKGMKPVSGGRVFPEARSINLTDKDAEWYCFLNDSKKVIITAKIPPAIVAKMKSSVKIACSDKGTFFSALPEKHKYTLGNHIIERIAVTTEARTITTNYNTRYFIEDNKPGDMENPNIWKYKAHWIPEVHGFNELVVVRVPLDVSNAVYASTPIDSPADDWGIGGTTGQAYLVSGSTTGRGSSESRLYCSGTPKYYITGGVKKEFTWMNGYYAFSGGLAGTTLDKPVLIVF